MSESNIVRNTSAGAVRFTCNGQDYILPGGGDTTMLPRDVALFAERNHFADGVQIVHPEAEARERAEAEFLVSEMQKAKDRKTLAEHPTPPGAPKLSFPPDAPHPDRVVTGPIHPPAPVMPPPAARFEVPIPRPEPAPSTTPEVPRGTPPSVAPPLSRAPHNDPDASPVRTHTYRPPVVPEPKPELPVRKPPFKGKR